MTVYKNTALEADLASKLAIDVIKGDKAAADALATGSVEDPTTHEQVKSALATPEAIFKDNIKKPFDDGFQKACGRLYRSVRQAVHAGRHQLIC